MITVVVFDLDDTLYDEIEYCRSGFTAVAKYLAGTQRKLPVEHIFTALWQQFTAGNRTKTFNIALEQLGVDYDDTLIQQLVQVYRNHDPQITLPQDSRDVLSQLQKKYILALLTDGFLPAQKLKVSALGIEKYFKSIVYTEELGRQSWKPSPAGFERLLAQLDARPQTSAYIADNEEKDFIAPNKLGLVTIQVIRPAHIHTSSSLDPDAAARYKIKGIDKLLKLLTTL
jgi:putative hydrolase of the HAD superfamily